MLLGNSDHTHVHMRVRRHIHRHTQKDESFMTRWFLIMILITLSHSIDDWHIIALNKNKLSQCNMRSRVAKCHFFLWANVVNIVKCCYVVNTFYFCRNTSHSCEKRQLFQSIIAVALSWHKTILMWSYFHDRLSKAEPTQSWRENAIFNQSQ